MDSYTHDYDKILYSNYLNGGDYVWLLTNLRVDSAMRERQLDEANSKNEKLNSIQERIISDSSSLWLRFNFLFPSLPKSLIHESEDGSNFSLENPAKNQLILIYRKNKL
uniref:Uncharacterized protein n=1 Tax=Glossina palpalis gambiensis TaxID=67801 RepID=A0A1B0AUG7_9MUSC